MIKLLVDSGCCLSPDFMKEHNITELHQKLYYKGDNIYSSIDWDSLDKDDFISYLEEGNLSKVAQPPIGDWISQIERLGLTDETAVFISMSEKLSGGVRAFNIIKKLLKYDLNIIEINGASSLINLFISRLVRTITDITTFEDIKRQADIFNEKARYFMITEDLKSWYHNGRADSDLNIPYREGCPLLCNQTNGALISLYMGKSFDDSLQKLSEILDKENASECIIAYTHNIYKDWLKKFEKVVQDKLKCRILSKDLCSPIVTSVYGAHGLDVSFI